MHHDGKVGIRGRKTHTYVTYASCETALDGGPGNRYTGILCSMIGRREGGGSGGRTEAATSEATRYNVEDSLRRADVYPPGRELEEVGEVI